MEIKDGIKFGIGFAIGEILITAVHRIIAAPSVVSKLEATSKKGA